MAKWIIVGSVTEVYLKDVEVEAEDEDEARNLARKELDDTPLEDFERDDCYTNILLIERVEEAAQNG